MKQINMLVMDLNQEAVKEAILVTPIWPSQPWWTEMVEYLVACPLWIPYHKDNVQIASDDLKESRIVPCYDLIMWSISNSGLHRVMRRDDMYWITIHSSPPTAPIAYL